MNPQSNVLTPSNQLETTSMPVPVKEIKLPKKVLIHNEEVEKAYSTMVNKMVLLFKQLPERYQSAVLIDYKYSPERKALEVHKLIHPMMWITLEAEPDMKYNITYSINYLLQGKKQIKECFYNRMVDIVVRNTPYDYLYKCTHYYFYNEVNLSEIERYKLIGDNAYITIANVPDSI